MTRRLAPIPNLQRLETAIAVEVYDYSSKNGFIYMTSGDLVEALKPLSSGLASQFLSGANINDYFEFDRDGDFKLTSFGLRYISDGLNNIESDVHNYLKSGMDWVLSDEKAPRPSSNDEHEGSWSPLPIDRASDEYKVAVSAIDAAIAEIEGSNGYASDEPIERNSIVLAIRGTYTALRESNPTLEAIRVGLLKPLRFVAEKFAGATLGELAKTAVGAILKWLATL